jgi:hypothetical protein
MDGHLARGHWASTAFTTWGICVTIACGSVHDDPEPPDAGLPAEDAGPQIYDAGGEAAVPPNGEDFCPSGVCNYQSLVGCSAGESCWPLADAVGGISPSCQPAGRLPGGASCGQWADCSPGHVCLQGVCRRLCCGKDWSACPTGESCIGSLSLRVGNVSVATGVDICLPVDGCDVLDPAACADQPGQTCQIVDPRGSVACMPGGSGSIGDPCDGETGCRAGLACIGGECRRLCRAISGGEPSCPAAEGVCVTYARDPEGVGECTPIGTL